MGEDQLAFFETKSKMSRVINKKTHSCESCGLYETAISPKMEPHGQGKKGLMLIGEAPGRKEDDEGDQFVGDVGQLLRRKLDPYDIDIDRDCFKINAINCRPPNNETPNNKQIKCCHSRVWQAIEELKPKYIWLLGGTALESFLLGRGFKDVKISNWRKVCIPDRKANCWVIPLYHPSAVLRDRGGRLESVFDRDLKWAVSCLRKEPPVFEDFEKKVILVKGYNEIMEFLNRILSGEWKIIDYDYETNSLDPRRDRSKLLSVSVALSDERAISFPYRYNNYWGWRFKDIEEAWKEIVKDSNIFKANQNIKFEEKWNRKYLGVKGEGWIHDTMICSHLLHQGRGRFTKLKLHAYVNFGVERYDQEIDPYMKSGRDGINKLEEFPLDKLLLYGGIDGIVTRWLRKKQEKEMERKPWLRKIYSLFHPGLITYMDVEEDGICIDRDYYEKEYKNLDRQMNEVYEKLLNSKEAKLFKEKVGRPIRISVSGGKISVSTNDLRQLLFTILGLKPKRLTQKSEQPSVDEEALLGMGISFASDIIKYRKMKKVADTYFAQFLREEVNGKVNPTVNLHIARTGRPSCSDPNFYNIPARDENARRLVRAGIIPSKRNFLLEGDYSGLETKIATCYSKDPMLIKYMNDPNSDMHRDQALKLFMINEKMITEKVRYVSKNGFVFPEFYGSWFVQCAENIWEDIKGKKLSNGLTVRRHLRNEGIRDLKDFTGHVESIEKEFWNMFSGFADWQDRELDFYMKHGYIESFTGFRRGGYLTKNMILNTSIQGSAYHCLLWSLNKIKKKRWKSKTVNQVYDSILYDAIYGEREILLEGTEDIMTKKIREAWDWIIVPLGVKFEESEVDGNWAEMKGV